MFLNPKLKMSRNGPKLAWTLKFNASKCKVLSITRKRHPLVAIYIVNGKTLEHVTSQKDVGVMISSDLKWKTQIYEQVNNANRMLGMIKRSTIHVKNLNTRSSLYLTLARSCVCLSSLESTNYHHVHGARKTSTQSDQIHTWFTF